MDKENKKEWLKIFIKVLIYALGLIGAYLGVNAMTSCTIARDANSNGKTTIVTVDTTIINHKGYVKTKNYEYD